MTPRLPSRAGAPIRVLVIDDHPIVRRGLVEAIDAEAGLTVCGEAGSAAEALAQASLGPSPPDVAVVDLSLGGESGLDLIAALAARHPDLRILVLSGHDERLYAERALHAGALGYVAKHRPLAELTAAIRKVAAGQTSVSEETTERLLGTMSGGRRPALGPLERLTDRERHVLTLIGGGSSTREIADRLGLSIKTIETHCAHIKAKLGLRHARDLTRAAVTLTQTGPEA
jgi:DNA-binding NarL/FixJ family response regulator